MPSSRRWRLSAALSVAAGLVLTGRSVEPSASLTPTSGLGPATTVAPTATTRPRLAAPKVTWTNMAGAGDGFWLAGTYPCGSSTCLVMARSTNGGSSFLRVGTPDVRYGGSAVIAALAFANGHDGYVGIEPGANRAAAAALFWTDSGGEAWLRVRLAGQLDSPVVATRGDAYALVTMCPSVTGYCRKLALGYSRDTSHVWRTRQLSLAEQVPQTDLAAFGSKLWLGSAPYGGGDLHVFVSRDGGRSLSALPTTSTVGPCRITATSSLTLWGFCSAGMAGTAIRSTDGGRSFSPLGWAPNSSNANDVVPLSNLVVAYESPLSAHLFVTTDGGQHFTSVLENPFGQRPLDVVFADASTWLAGAFSATGLGRLWRSETGGRSWTQLPVPTLKTIGTLDETSTTAVRCRLAGGLGPPVSSATGEHAANVTLTNRGQGSCDLSGYPAATPLTVAGGTLPFLAWRPSLPRKGRDGRDRAQCDHPWWGCLGDQPIAPNGEQYEGALTHPACVDALR